MKPALAISLLLGIAGCGRPAETRGPSGPPQPKTTDEVRIEAGVGLRDAEWEAVASRRFAVELALPERRAWQVDDARAPWWTARHAATGSELALRTWRGARLPSRAECEKQARLWRPELTDPAREPESVVERRALGVPAGFDTELTLGVRPTSLPGEIEGYAQAYGASVGRCFAAVFVSRASGPGAEAVVGRRLALVADAVLPTLRARGIDERVAEPGGPTGPVP